MAKVLYITANPKSIEQSYSLQVGQAFAEAYKEANPNDELVHLDLFKLDIPQIDADVFSGWGKLGSGTGFDQLTDSEKAKVGRLSEIVNEYVEADKYVFVTPMWNFSFPPVMKAYIDATCVAGKTFAYTEKGPVGLLNGKKAFHIQACGGVYSEGPAAGFESASSYLSKVMQFQGVPSFDKLFVEGMAAMPDQAQSIKEKAIEKAKEAAKAF
jgi:FMN-dependent NADH-azoreductase